MKTGFDKTRIQFQGAFILRNCFLVLSLKLIREAKINRLHRRQWIEIARNLHLVQRFVGMSLRRKIRDAVSEVRLSVPGVELDSALELTLSHRPIEFIERFHI